MHQKMARGFRAGKWRRQCTRPSGQIPYEFARARDADDYELPIPDIMRHSFVILLTVGALACSAARTLTPLSGTSAAITEDDLRHRLYLIADDSMMGRESGSRGDFLTAEYVAAEFRRLGLEAAGENGTFFQTVPFWIAAVDPQSRLQSGTTSLQLGSDFVPASIGAAPRTLDGTAVVYGGPATDTTRWISADQAAGKVVVLDLPPGASMRGVAFAGPRWRGGNQVHSLPSAGASCSIGRPGTLINQRSRSSQSRRK